VKRSRSSSALNSASEIAGVFHPSNDDPRLQLLERVLSSSQFRGSLRLREILIYIADCALKDTPEAATEQQIGMHVFNRPPGYNSSEDSIVRTHARLLRQKLAEYFASEGAAEATVIEVPKGHYLPVFRLREAEQVQLPGPVNLAELTSPPREKTAAPTVRRRLLVFPVRLAFGWLIALVLGVCGYLAVHALHKGSSESPAIDAFWSPFLTGDPPVVIYSNTRFQGNSKTGLKYAAAGGGPGEEPIVDHYTGIGEVASVYELTRLFDAHHASFILKRSLLVTWDEAKSKNLIFIGSPAENPSLRALPPLTDFTMVADPTFAGFVNNHPRPGEKALYSRPEQPLTMDYAVIALMPGVQSEKRTLRFSGLTTLGTQAAVEFASRKDSVTELLKSVTSPSGEVRPFEALLEVALEGGVPLQSKLVAVRVH
jgi:hypothetical protein